MISKTLGKKYIQQSFGKQKQHNDVLIFGESFLCLFLLLYIFYAFVCFSAVICLSLPRSGTCPAIMNVGSQMPVAEHVVTV